MSSIDRLVRQLLANRVRDLRRAQGLSVPALAAHADLSPRCIYDIEAAATNPRLLTLVRVAGGLNVATRTLFAASGAVASPDHASPPPPAYRVEQVFVMHRETGLLLRHVNLAKRGPLKDPDVIAGMLTAIQDFVRDSFRGCGRQRLLQLAVAQRVSLVLAHSSHTSVVAVTRLETGRGLGRLSVRDVIGPAGLEALQPRLQALADHIDRTYEAPLRAFRGDVSVFKRVSAVVRAVFCVEVVARHQPAA